MKNVLIRVGCIFSFVLCLPIIGHSQYFPNLSDTLFRGAFGLSSGYSSMAGYAIGMEYSMKFRSNNIGATLQMNSEIYQSASGFITPVYYNDKFYELALYYGRLIQVNRIVFQADVGPSFYIFKDKSLAQSGGMINTNVSTSVTSKSVGLFGKITVDCFLSKTVLLGLYLGGNVNVDLPIWHSGLRFTALF